MKKENGHKRKNPIYGNCGVFSPDGHLMFRCTDKRINWYLSRNLATIYNNNPNDIILTFTPKGLGSNGDNYGLKEKKNICVVCGLDSLEEITKHHIVPLIYRKHFSLHIKSRAPHDIVPICIEHHYEYERAFALVLKRELAEQYNAPLEKIKSEDAKYLIGVKAAYVLVLNEDKIPADRVEILKERIREALEKKHITNADIRNLAKVDPKECYSQIDSHGKIVMDSIGNLQTFVEMGRQHLIDSMEPMFMPEYCDVNILVLTHSRHSSHGAFSVQEGKELTRLGRYVTVYLYCLTVPKSH